MKKIEHVVTALLMTCAIQSANAEPALVDDDLQNCEVLLGRAKQAAFTTLQQEAKQAAASGDADHVMRYGAILNNRMACIDEEATGSSGWGVIMSNGDGSQVEAVHTPSADPGKIPALAETLREAIRNYERVSETELNARVMLGNYYADYHAFLQQPDKGYLYLASVWNVECRTTGKRIPAEFDRCINLRQNRILYNSLLSPKVRPQLDARASAWADRYIVRMSE